MNKVISFDIFDTCLVRTTGKPESVFEILARTVINSASDADILDFIKIRKEGEISARQTSLHKEVTIEEIYDKCDFSVLTSMKNQDILNAELSIEESVLLPVHKIKEKIDYFRAKKWIICFISDIYLPEKFIKYILQKFGLLKEGDRLYLSSTYLATKSYGNLYKIFKKDFPFVNFFNWIHNGDNFYSDFINALKNGALPKRICHSFNDRESITIDSIEPVLARELNKYLSISKALRVSHSKDKLYSFAVDVIAPMYVSYMINVLTLAKKRGIKDLFFFARDGYLFYIIAKQFQDDFKGISFHYVYISRKAIYYPTLEDISLDRLKTVFPRKISVKNVLDTLLVGEEELDEFTLKSIINENDRDKVLSILCSNVDIFLKIKDRHSKQQNIVLEYFKQEGMAITTNTAAIVDLRGTRKSHEMINDFLVRNKYCSLYGFYYEVLDDRVNPKRKDSYYSCIFREQFWGTELFEALESFTPIFEQYFSITNQQRTSHYRKNGSMVVPVFEDDGVKPYVDTLFTANKNACLDFCKYAKIIVSKENSETISRIVLCHFLNSLANFDKNTLRFFENFEMSENKYEKKVYLKRLTVHDLLSHNHIMWFKGSIVFTFGRLPYYILESKKWLRKIIFK